MKLSDYKGRIYVNFANSFLSTKEIMNSEEYKNQYTYKLMLFIKGSATVEIDDEQFISSSGSVVFLVPGEAYRVLNTNGEFSVVNIYFTFDEKCNRNYTYNKFFDRSLCTEKLYFEDAKCFNKSFVSNNIKILEKANRILKIFNLNSELKEFMLSGYMVEILGELYWGGVNENVIGEKISTYISDNCEENLNASMLSDVFNRHPNHINRIIKNYTGHTLSEYITLKKIEKASVYLCESEMSITDIAQKLSFFDGAHFTRTFKKTVGVTPSVYRKML